TIAKAIFFFRLIKGRISYIAFENAKHGDYDEFINNIYVQLTGTFVRLFLPFILRNTNFEVVYHYSSETSIRISAPDFGKPKEIVKITFSNSIMAYLKELHTRISTANNWSWSKVEQAALNNLLSDWDSSVFFIPAGRSSVTLMANQLSAFFSSMDDLQKLRTGFCTEYYANLVQQFQTTFSRGIDGILTDAQILGGEIDTPFIKKAPTMISSIIKGKYRYQNGMSTLVIEPDNQAIEMNYASSGQQEAVWITNFIFYLLIAEGTYPLIVEEPESNLYPDTQKKMTELLSLFHNAGNQVLITTHSPYVLGTLNNLIYASDIDARGVSGVEKIIDRDVWLNKNSVSAWHMENGVPDPATEGELGLIRNEAIDGASIELTDESDALYELSAREE
ncbi:MAG: ATP-binding protein, partial [Oscillibacter sp.]|nr:ATP-binding protein [Oscillibacter sp.]